MFQFLLFYRVIIFYFILKAVAESGLVGQMPGTTPPAIPGMFPNMFPLATGQVCMYPNVFVSTSMYVCYSDIL